MDEVFDVLVAGKPGWITANAELVPAKSATKKKGFTAIMLMWSKIRFGVGVGGISGISSRGW
jgi:hypothetical protein